MCVVVLYSAQLMDTAHAFNIGIKGHVSGPAIHTTYFLTPNNQAFEVQAKLYVGYFLSGSCRYLGYYDIGRERLKTGDVVDIDGFALRSLIGGGYDCVTLYYTYRQMVFETIILTWDGFNYTSSYPQTSEITIL